MPATRGRIALIELDVRGDACLRCGSPSVGLFVRVDGCRRRDGKATTSGTEEDLRWNPPYGGLPALDEPRPCPAPAAWPPATRLVRRLRQHARQTSIPGRVRGLAERRALEWDGGRPRSPSERRVLVNGLPPVQAGFEARVRPRSQSGRDITARCSGWTTT